MEQFMLIYKGGDANWMAKASGQEIAASKAEWQAWVAALQENEQLVSLGAPLIFSGFTVAGDGVVNDLSATQVSELVTGYSFIKADNMDEAVSWAKKSPYFRYPESSVEVRQVTKMDSSDSASKV
ncbi:YciI family protein [Thalassomonas sp. RHCl1]|uniref:YciI family protein n=1 Tax=Thalassomonas sp. RHCl1 TaxID=2995320 RepID=UPI00248AC2D9|nr:YciI family protein [Thalassomonas sp. RHCl1]